MKNLKESFEPSPSNQISWFRRALMYVLRPIEIRLKRLLPNSDLDQFTEEQLRLELKRLKHEHQNLPHSMIQQGRGLNFDYLEAEGGRMQNRMIAIIARLRLLKR